MKYREEYTDTMTRATRGTISRGVALVDDCSSIDQLLAGTLTLVGRYEIPRTDTELFKVDRNLLAMS